MVNNWYDREDNRPALSNPWGCWHLHTDNMHVAVAFIVNAQKTTALFLKDDSTGWKGEWYMLSEQHLHKFLARGISIRREELYSPFLQLCPPDFSKP